MSSVLVTGGAGYLGSALLPRLRELDARVMSVDSDTPNGALSSGHLHADVRAWRPAAPWDVCVHLAAITGVQDCERDPELAYSVNGHAAARALTWPVARHIYVSTGGVYGAATGDLTEDDDVKPQGVYCSSKAGAEEVVLGAGGCVLRLNHLTGMAPRMRWREIGNCLARSAAEGRIEIYDPLLWRPYLHVQDAARIIAEVACLAPDRFPKGRIYNVCAENRTKGSIGAQLSEMTGAAVRYEERGIDRWDYRLSSERLYRELALRPQNTLTEALKEVVACHRPQ